MCVSVLYTYNPLKKQPADSLTPLDVTTSLEVEPGRYYQSKGQYHLDMTGVATTSLPIKNLPEELNQYNTLIIEGFNGFRNANIYLTAQLSNSHNETVLFKQKLIRADSSINVLSESWQRADTITDVSLLFESNVALGFTAPSDLDINWRSIFFTIDSQLSPWRVGFSQLNGFVPLSYSSINLYNGEAIAIYKPILIIPGLWVVISVILFYLIRPATYHLLLVVICAWLMAAIVYGINFYQQSEFNQHQFTRNNPFLNDIDRQVAQIASRINTSLISQDNTESAKIMIMGGDDFSKKRLNFHLLQHNVGIIGDFETLVKILAQTNSFAVLLPPYNNICNETQQPSAAKSFDIVLLSNRFCFIQ